jgi:hypothetical protein
MSIQKFYQHVKDGRLIPASPYLLENPPEHFRLLTLDITKPIEDQLKELGQVVSKKVEELEAVTEAAIQRAGKKLGLPNKEAQ